MTVTLVAALTGQAPDAAAAAHAGARSVMVTMASTRAVARLPFELSDFDAGEVARTPALTREAIEALATGLARHGTTLVVSVDDAAGLASLARLPLAAVHVAAPAVVDLALVAAAAATGMPVWLDTAMTTLDEVTEAVAAAVKAGARPTVLHGLATVPARPDEVNLGALVTLRERFGPSVGFSLREPTAVLATAAAALGATVITVPFGPGGFDAAAFAALDADVRLIARAVGDGDKRVQASEWAERDRAHPSLVARVDIARGTTVTADMLTTARPGLGLKPRAIDGIVGRRAAADIAAGTLLTLGMLE